jgi:hypothetical protein
MWRIELEIFSAALDPTQADRLMLSIALIFTTLKTLTSTAQIAPEDRSDGWVLVLPSTNEVEIDGPIETPLHDDPKDVLYSYATSLPITFETQAYIRYAERTSARILVGSRPAINSALPDTIPLAGGPFFANIVHRPLGAKFISSDTAVAVVDTNGYVYPKRLGEFTFAVLSQHSGEPPDVLFQKTVRVV